MLTTVKMEQLSPRTRELLLELHRTLIVDHPEFWGVQITFEGPKSNVDQPPTVHALL